MKDKAKHDIKKRLHEEQKLLRRALNKMPAPVAARVRTYCTARGMLPGQPDKKG